MKIIFLLFSSSNKMQNKSQLTKSFKTTTTQAFTTKSIFYLLQPCLCMFFFFICKLFTSFKSLLTSFILPFFFNRLFFIPNSLFSTSNLFSTLNSSVSFENFIPDVRDDSVQSTQQIKYNQEPKIK